jgi:hypothetical protein
MLKSQVNIKTNLFKLFIFLSLVVTNSGLTLAAPRKDQDVKQVNECTPPKLDVEALIKGLVLRSKAGYFLNELVEKERKTKGYEPQVLIVARAGQDLSGALVLRDLDDNGQLLTVKDMFNKVIGPHQLPYSDGLDDQQKSVAPIQYQIKRKFRDRNRKLIYSHMGILILNHSIKSVEHTFDQDEKLVCPDCEFMVDELLKPCESLVPKKWVTGLAGFYQDDPHEYRTLFIVPTPEIQSEIKKIIDEKSDDAYVLKQGRNNFDLFLGDHYNAAAKYTDQKEQNSNQYVLEIIAAAQMKLKTDRLNATTTRNDVLNYLTETGFRPTKIIADSFKMGFATSGFAPNSLRIHDRDNAYARPFNVSEFVTELSVREWMQRQGIVKSADDMHAVLITEKDVAADTEIRKITEEQAREFMAKAKKQDAEKKAARAKAKTEVKK